MQRIFFSLLCFSLSFWLFACGSSPTSPDGNTDEPTTENPNSTDLRTEPIVTPDDASTPSDEPKAPESPATPDEPSQPDPPLTPDEPNQPEPPPIPDKPVPPETNPTDNTTPDNTPPENNTPDIPPKWLGQVRCGGTPPAGAKLAPAPPTYTGGTCPKLVAGANTITSKGNQRKFLLVLPSKMDPNKTYPLIFLWHWLKGNATKFLTQGDIQKAVNQQKFIAIIPEAKGDIKFSAFGRSVAFPWPFMTNVSDARMQEEFSFFDDMLACASKQFQVDKECVSSAGVSAGALFTTQLAQARSNYLASFISLSGGIGSSGGGGFNTNGLIRRWKAPSKKLPAVVLWGGPSDSCVLLNFQTSSQALQKELSADGHFFLECIHNCKHSEPPITPAAGSTRYAAIWEFAFRHPFWLPDGTSPYQVIGWPNAMIPWCAIGAGKANIRQGQCGPASCDL